MNLKKNVVECLWVVHMKVGGSRYQFRVQAESETTAKARAARDARLRFNTESDEAEVLRVEKIEPGDFV